MPDLEDFDEDYYEYTNRTSEEIERVEAGVKNLLTPNINFKFSDSDEDYMEVPENTFSLKHYIKSWFITDDDSERGYHFKTISERRAEY